MGKLTIHQWSGEKRDVRFVGYNRAHTACFIRDEHNSRRAITLLLPKLFELRFHENPIGKDGSPLIEISRAALHLPACFATKEEAQAFDNPHSPEMQAARVFGDDLWKAVTPHKCWLEPKDHKELVHLHREELARLRRHHNVRQSETSEQIAAINKEIAALPPSHPAHVLGFHQNRIKELQNMLRGEFDTTTRGKNNAFKFISIFDTSIDMVRDGWGGLREQLLEREWAKHFGWNLKTIPTEAANFHAWLEKRAYNARYSTADLDTRTVETSAGLRLDFWQWEVLEASIRYEVRFTDGTRCWLDDIEERGVTDPLEVEDFYRLEEAAETSDQDRLSLETILTRLGSERKGKHMPMGRRGFKELCQREKIDYDQVLIRGMKPSLLAQLLDRRQRQKQARVTRLKRFNAEKHPKASALSTRDEDS